MSYMEPIPFIHRENSRARSVKISLDEQGNVIVTTPPRFLASRIPPFVEQARSWIKIHQEQLVHRPILLDAHSVLYFGTPYDFVVHPHKTGQVQVGISTIEIAPVDSSERGIMTSMEKWLKNRAIEYIIPRTKKLSEAMRTEYNQVHFREQKTRWGSCSSDKNLNFNWRLIHAPKAVIDYVIIHELSHTVHMNHGSRFWELVAHYDPDHPLHRGWLKRFGGEEG
ncbi:hypothetical protein C5B42_04520 [Candidatus Cerribacteria bacterium 'Amazon FNV 2010 28 9']|uniref:YgjP-like metallopeptidase domain-containing protein n=1 Tax=Candidatus Cerribacteria bacterium 'Amazon FNV 2010 28 9' TaxID=2081795 RepID=A0A317JPE7_9BACT|nr:MAG: hypothetical protein C5B42_04520 [Candidatus Cerribacteria bacterium 'Amazon FNV 2010 28 9']